MLNKVFSLGKLGCSLACSCSGGPCTITVCLINSCSSSTKLVGSTVWIYSGATLITSGTTGAGGCVTLTIPSAGSYDVQYQLPGATLVDTGNHSLSCGGTLNITTDPTAAGYVCCGYCPVPRTLTLTDVNTTIALHFPSTVADLPPAYGLPGCSFVGSSLQAWTGSYLQPVTGVVTTPDGFTCVGSTTATDSIRVWYVLCCVSSSSTSPPTFNLFRFWQVFAVGPVVFGGPYTCYYISPSFYATYNCTCYSSNSCIALVQSDYNLGVAATTCSSFALSATPSGAATCASGPGSVDPAAGAVMISA